VWAAKAKRDKQNNALNQANACGSAFLIPSFRFLSPESPAPMLLHITHLSKRYGTLTVLDSVSLSLYAGQRIGLVGPNGVGKSTLIHILTGAVTADDGQITPADGLRIGHLPQDLGALRGTLASLTHHALGHIHAMEAEMRALEHAISDASGAPLADLLDRYSTVSEAFELAGGYDLEARTAEVMSGLGVAHLPPDRDVTTLSGGERTRLSLALLLLSTPDVLLLDEPTNHLDAQALAWLEAALAQWRGAVLMVSHDRAFLNHTVTHIVELDEHTHRLRHYTGDYDAYRTAKQREREQWEADWQAQQDELKDLRIAVADQRRAMAQTKPTRKVGGDKFAKGFFKGRTEVGLTRKLDNLKERLARIEEDPIEKPHRPLTFRASFDPRRLDSRAPLTAAGICKQYAGTTVLSQVSLSLGIGQRVALVGPNGAGKSTLLRILAGLEIPDSGEIIRSGQTVIGYLDQHGGDFDPHLTVAQAYGIGLDGSDDAHVADLLNWGLFRYDEVRRPVGVLSVGQRRKLQIARLIASGANVLLLDEPTNHLSFDVLEAFETALDGFKGAILAATHDRRFLERFGGEVWRLQAGLCVSSPTA
jgi:macrolide transport system ATP-binding/permease protein